MAHLQEHQQMLSGEVDYLINEHDSLKQKIMERQEQNSQNLALLGHIDRWEAKSIEVIRREAEECRQSAIKQTKKTVEEIDQRLVQFAGQLKLLRAEDNFNELDISRLKQELTRMQEQLDRSVNIYTDEDSTQFIPKIRISAATEEEKQGRIFLTSCRISLLSFAELKTRAWHRHANTVAGGNGIGGQFDQLSRPWGIAIDQNKSVLIADHFNHRIARWTYQAESGTVIAGGGCGNGQGKRTGQLNYPTDVLVDKRDHSLIIADAGNKRVIRWDERRLTNPQILVDNIECRGLAMDQEGFLYVSDEKKHEVIRWKEGEAQTTVVAGGNARGKKLNQLDGPSFLFVDDQRSVYVSDSQNHRVLKYRIGAGEGVVVAGGCGQGDKLNQLSCPQGVLVDRLGHIYVADRENNRVVRWREGDRKGKIVAGENLEGKGRNQFSHPNGLALDDEGNLYVADCLNSRVQRFDLVSNPKCHVQ